jgi:hypothetical protein
VFSSEPIGTLSRGLYSTAELQYSTVMRSLSLDDAVFSSEPIGAHSRTRVNN